MQVIKLQPTPNQEFTITLDAGKYDIALRTIDDITYATISRGDVQLVNSVRCIPSRPLIPYRYLEGTGGNFLFQTQNDELPNYTQFGITHVFLYASNAELAAWRAGG